MKNKWCFCLLVVALFILAHPAMAVNQYWDTDDVAAGYQHGDGTWSATETKWTLTGTSPLAGFTNGNDAYFSATGGASAVTLTGVVTAGMVNVMGSVYTLTITNGGQLYATSSVAFGKNYSYNSLLITGTNSALICGTNEPVANLLIGHGTTTGNVVCVDDRARLDVAGVRIGTNAASVGNMLIITNGARFNSYGSAVFYVGEKGPNNQLVVAGTAAKNTRMDGGGTDLYVGGAGTATNNLVLIDGGGDENGAIVTNIGAMKVGATSANFNQLIVTNKGRLYISSSLQVGGQNMSADDNMAIVAQGGKIKAAGGGLSIGQNNSSHRNKLIVRDPGSVYDHGGGTFYIGGGAAAGSPRSTYGSLLLVENEGVVTNIGSLSMGLTTYGFDLVANQVRIANKGTLYSSGDVIISSGDSHCNTGLVTGAGSVWNMGGGTLYLSYGMPSPSNTFIIDDSGLVTNAGPIRIPGRVNVSNICNALIVTNGGLLYSTGNSTIGEVVNVFSNRAVVTGSNSLWNLGWKSLTIGNANSLNYLAIDQGGTVDAVGTLTVVSNNALELRGGTLVVSNLSYNNGLVFTVGDGVQTATLKTTAGPGNIRNGLLVNSNGVLGGKGIINAGEIGVIVTNKGVVEPGVTGVGALTNAGLFTLAAGSFARFKIATNTTAGAGWDLLVVTNGTLTLGGTIQPVLIGGYKPSFSDSFIVISNKPTNAINSIVGGFDNATSGRVTAQTTNSTRIVGSFRIGVSNQYVVLDNFRPHYGGTAIGVK